MIFQRADPFIELSGDKSLWLSRVVDHNGSNTQAKTSLGEEREASWYNPDGIAERLPDDEHRRSTVFTGSDRLARAEAALERLLQSRPGDQSTWNGLHMYFRAAFTGGRLLVVFEGGQQHTASMRGAVVQWHAGFIEHRFVVAPLSTGKGTTEVLRCYHGGVQWAALERYSGRALYVVKQITVE